jgi:hypothetical protein
MLLCTADEEPHRTQQTVSAQHGRSLGLCRTDRRRLNHDRNKHALACDNPAWTFLREPRLEPDAEQNSFRLYEQRRIDVKI